MASTEPVEDRPASRRARYRAATVAEIKAHALHQIARGGIGALSLNGIARAMGMTGPALYRYYAGRDELLTELLVDGYATFATRMENARDAGPGGPAERLRAVASAYRQWALTEPHVYELLFGTPLPGYHAPEGGTRAEAQRGLAVTIGLWWELLDGLPPIEREQRARELAVVGWARLHGFVALELRGEMATLVGDPDRLFTEEIDRLLTGA
jgi:AcrR family transcriptional regulator